MQYPFNARTPPFDAQAIQDTIERALAGAGLDTSNGTMRDVTETIRRALGGSGRPDSAPAPAGTVIDVPARFVDGDEVRGGDLPSPAAPGSFRTHAFRNAAGTRAYKLYVPATPHAGGRRPMLLMLHGCTQSADDFAIGTRMNRLADAHGFVVVYPEQAAQANPSRCWNWFQAQDQRRDGAEPSLIAGIVGEVAARHDVDPGRIFVAGLSAGAAMALVLGESYPELFAGVGVHSGLPYASAHDIPSAMAAMKGGRRGRPGQQAAHAAPAPSARAVTQPTPLIVFHGDRDHTVHQTNAVEIVRQAAEAHRARPGAPALETRTDEGQAAGGRRYTRTTHRDPGGRPRIEFWSLHGAGHAWSGGDPRGSYAEATGPDASAEMVRFFLAQSR